MPHPLLAAVVAVHEVGMYGMEKGLLAAYAGILIFGWARMLIQQLRNQVMLRRWRGTHTYKGGSILGRRWCGRRQSIPLSYSAVPL